MTAEIAIMNKEAVAIAADSATTVSGEKGEKTFTSANKIFALSKYEPVSIMVYGNANFMGIPWEAVIKIYRSEFGKRKFQTLKEYGDDFISFLGKENRLFPESEQNKYFLANVYSYFALIKNEIEKEVETAIIEREKITESEIKGIIAKTIGGHYDGWQRAEVISSIPQNHISDLKTKYGAIIEMAIKEVFQKLPIEETLSKQLTEIASSLFVKFPEALNPPFVSGVVIAGFGVSDIFPSLKSFFVEGVANNQLKFKEHKYNQITLDNSAAIVPFAQSEMVTTFMWGVDPNYQQELDRFIAELLQTYPHTILENIEKLDSVERTRLTEKLNSIGAQKLEEYKQRLGKYRRTTYIDPVIDVVAVLPKDELAAMAESLVNLTSFKRRVSMEKETVGGPIDVAIISKGDGLIWIKRKHYFAPELNRQFFANYYREEQNGGTK